ncbi:MAG: D-alanyl-lipoteichoic acid acyltransferase DltB (MBOAT superfamily), partial [Bacteroidia bacterium]
MVDYGCGMGIFVAKEKWEKKLYLMLSIASNIGLLAFFKYSYFFVDTINNLFGTELQAVNLLAAFANGTFGASFDIHDIILPVGISFYTFQTLSYSIDVYRGKIKPCGNIFDFAFFVSFFPQLVAGPIVRASEFLPQIKRPYYLSSSGFGSAVFLIMGGLIKKVVISDYISINFVDRVFETPEMYSGFMNLMAVYGYSIQIYCDFSGYSDIAIGLAALLGFRLPINFNSPYKAQNITDFWRRWHISLSTWLRDYLYISLGGNRKSKIRTYFNLFITMLIGGLWHGAALKFIIWGALHGVALMVHKAWQKYARVDLGKYGK